MSPHSVSSRPSRAHIFARGARLLACALTLGCGLTDPGDERALVETDWRVVTLEGVPLTTAGSATRHLWFVREPGLIDPVTTFRATVGCNSIAGSVRTSARTIVFDEMMSTDMACADPLMSSEQRMLRVLGAARRWDVADGVLSVRDGSGAVVAVFEPAR